MGYRTGKRKDYTPLERLFIICESRYKLYVPERAIDRKVIDMSTGVFLVESVMNDRDFINDVDTYIGNAFRYINRLNKDFEVYNEILREYCVVDSLPKTDYSSDWKGYCTYEN